MGRQTRSLNPDLDNPIEAFQRGPIGMEYSPCRGETPGPMGFGGDHAEQLVNHRMTEVQDYVLRHQLNSEGLAEATMLESHIFPFPRATYRIWRLGDAWYSGARRSRKIRTVLPGPITSQPMRSLQATCQCARLGRRGGVKMD